MRTTIIAISVKLSLALLLCLASMPASSAVDIPEYTEATRPPASPATLGRLIRLLDGPRGLYFDNGAQWVSLSGSVINVEDFGANGSDNDDDRAAIQAAIDAAAVSKGTVFFPPGTYVVSEKTGYAYALLLKSSIQLVGAGRSASVIKLADMPDCSWVRVLSGSALQNVTIRDLGIDGNYAANVTGSEQMAGIFLNGCTNITMENLSLQNTRGDGVLLYGGCNRINISNSFFNGNHRDGIALTGHQGVVVHGNHFENIASTAIDNEPDGGQGGDVVITANFIDSTVLHGISIGANPIDGFRRVSVHGNIVNTGIDIARAESVNLVGNIIRGPDSGPALVISHTVRDVRLIDNQISSGSASPAVTMYAAAPGSTMEIPQNIVLSSNSITTTGSIAVEAKGVCNLILQGNVISGPGSGQGILLHATVPRMREIAILGNLIRGFATGIFATTTSANRIDGLMVVNNQFTGVAKGIELVTTLQFVDNLTVSNNAMGDTVVTPLSHHVSQLVRVSGNGQIQARYSGSGTPQGNVAAPVGSTFLRRDGTVSASFYLKEYGTDSIGWVNK